MSDDITRLREWMKANNCGLKQLAEKMDMPYITAHTVVERRASTTDQFVNRFIRSFGYDLAKQIFSSHLSPVNEKEVA